MNTRTPNTTTPRGLPARSPRRLPTGSSCHGLTVTEMLRRFASMDWALRVPEAPEAHEAVEELEVSP